MMVDDIQYTHDQIVGLLALYGFTSIEEVFQRAEVHKFWERSPLIGTAKVSKEFIFLEANEVTCEILGKSYGELIGTSFPEITPEPIRSIDIANANLLIQGTRREYQLAKFYEPRKGQFIFVVIHPVSVLGSEGEFCHFSVLILPVTVEDYQKIQRRTLRRIILPPGYSISGKSRWLKWMLSFLPKRPSEWIAAIVIGILAIGELAAVILHKLGINVELPW